MIPPPRADPVRVLLSFGTRSQGLGDSAIGTTHHRDLNEAFGAVAMTVHSSDGHVWKALFGAEVACIERLPREDLGRDCDLVVFDGVRLDSIADVLARCPVPVVELPLTGSFRLKLPGEPWREVALPPQVNRPRRSREAYEALGLVSGAPNATRRRKASNGAIFLNPYASGAVKCLDPVLLGEIVEALATRGPASAIRCPSAPSAPPGEAETYARLSAVVTAAAQRGIVELLAPMSLARYLDCIATAALAIGPDTSTQHVAATLGTPSIAAYTADSGYWYLFWASLGPRNVAFRTPGSPAGVRALANAIATLARAIVDGTSQCNGSALGAEAEHYVAVCRALANHDLELADGRRTLAASMRRLRAMLPAEWRSVVLAELVDIGADIARRALVEPYAPDQSGLARLREVNAAAVLHLLDGRAGGEREETPARAGGEALLPDS